MSAADLHPEPVSAQPARAALSRSAVLVATALALGAAVGWFVAGAQDDVYRAEATLAVQAENPAAHAEGLAELAQTEVLARNVIGNLRLDESPSELLDTVEIAVTDAPTLRIRVDDPDPQWALRVATELSLVFSQLVREEFTEQPVAVTVFEAAHVLEDPVAPNPARAAVAGGALGGVAGLAAALLLAARVRRVLPTVAAPVAEPHMPPAADAPDDRAATRLEEREAQLAARVATVTKRELALAKSAAALAVRERELAARAAAPAPAPAPPEPEPPAPQPAVPLPAMPVPQAAPPPEPVAPEPAPAPGPTAPEPIAPAPIPAAPEPVAPAPPPVAPVPVATGGGFNLETLHRLVDDYGDAAPEQLEEWRYYLVYLRDHADAHGRLPGSFDWLIDDVFGDVAAGARL